MVTVTAAKVRRGSQLNRESSRRLNHSARLLLETGGDGGVALGLWSLAVEALGQAHLLDDQIQGREPEDSVTVQPGFDHRRSFQRALRELPEVEGSRLARVLRVSPGADHNRQASDPLTGAKMFIPAFTSGKFRDLTDGNLGVLPSVDLRFNLLYVQWDPRAQEWSDNRIASSVYGRRVAWEVEPQDIMQVIATLGQHLDPGSTPR